jgi:SAM-dependent methyltransferase
MISLMPAPLRKEEGSFRDPTGQVWIGDSEVLRFTSAQQGTVIDELLHAGILGKLSQKRLVIETVPVENGRMASLAEVAGRFERAFSHPKLDFISYPAEWSPSMLADAADLTLRLQELLINRGFALKDATPYNVQFQGSHPLFIDAGSFCRPARNDIWHVLGQFQRGFLYPLILAAHAGWDLRSYFLGRMDGRSALDVAAALGRKAWLRPSLWLDCALPAYFERRQQRTAKESTGYKPGKDRGVAVQLMTLRRLRKLVARLARKTSAGSHWVDYTATCTYTDEATAIKKDAINRWLERLKPDQTLDIGCNTGEFSRIAATKSRLVISGDTDSGCVGRIYAQAKSEGLPIHPIVTDITNPTPGYGHLNTERKPLFDRLQSDCVLALALTHHLRVGGNLDPENQSKLFAKLSKRHLIIEFVPTSDEMFRKLAELRDETYADWTPAKWLAAFERRFRVVDKVRIPSLDRTLYLLEKSS